MIDFSNKKRVILYTVGFLTIALVMGLAIGIPLSQNKNSKGKAIEILDKNPLIDGHNDLVHVLRKEYRNQFKDFDISTDMKNKSHTDIIRAKQGKLGGQFWAAYSSCDSSGKDALRLHMEQTEVLRRIIDRHPNDMQFVTTAQGIRDAFKNKKIASLIGMESGHAIQSSLSILRVFYAMGIRYMTLTHNCNTPWASNNLVDDNPDSPEAQVGLTEFGQLVIKEMNRLGMLVDLSHTSHQTQLDTFQITKAPVIYSHSSAYALCNHTRNTHDDALRLLHENRGIIMVNFFSGFITCSQNNGNVSDVVEHINYIRDVTGSTDNIGIGSDYDGVGRLPEGLEDVSTYPNLFAALIDDGWKEKDLIKLAGGNLLRVLEDAEKYAKSVENEPPYDDIISQDDLNEESKKCRTGF